MKNKIGNSRTTVYNDFAIIIPRMYHVYVCFRFAAKLKTHISFHAIVSCVPCMAMVDLLTGIIMSFSCSPAQFNIVHYCMCSWDILLWLFCKCNKTESLFLCLGGPGLFLLQYYDYDTLLLLLLNNSIDSL